MHKTVDYLAYVRVNVLVNWKYYISLYVEGIKKRKIYNSLSPNVLFDSNISDAITWFYAVEIMGLIPLNFDTPVLTKLNLGEQRRMHDVRRRLNGVLRRKISIWHVTPYKQNQGALGKQHYNTYTLHLDGLTYHPTKANALSFFCVGFPMLRRRDGSYIKNRLATYGPRVPVTFRVRSLFL